MDRFVFSISMFLLVMVSCAQPEPSGVVVKDLAQGKFLMGAALNQRQVKGGDSSLVELITQNFDAIVAENCMKMESLHPAPGVYDFAAADSFVRFGQKHGLVMTGHVLIWHSQCPAWFFKDEKGNDVSREVLLSRMREHIYTVCSHFKGKLKGWDVVNEAIEDDGSWRQSKFFKIVGPEFIDSAFRYAREADADIELYYNDYNMAAEERRNAVVALVRHLKENGIDINGVGMQTHIGMDYPELDEYEKSLEAFAAEGVKIHVTELELSALPNPEPFFFGAAVEHGVAYKEKMNPYTKGLPDSVSEAWNERMLQLFELFRRHADVMERVTFWGLTDGDSWKNNWPMRGRTDYPLAIDRSWNVKPFVKEFVRQNSKM